MTDNLTLQMNTECSLRDVVFNTLRDAILIGELSPGERLMETKLANRLGVSRTPVREAIHMLESEGLAVTAPHCGARVAAMTEEDLENVLEIRCSLEELAVSKAAINISNEQLTKLEKSLDHFEQAVRRRDVRLIVEIDEEFHQTIFQASGNPRLHSMIINLKGQMLRYRYQYIRESADHKALLLEHRQIFDSLKNHDPDAAKRHIRGHLDNQLEGVRAVIRKGSKGVPDESR